MGECAGERAFPVAFGRVDNHAGPFVDDDDRIIFVENVEWDVLRFGPLAGSSNLIDDDDAARV